MITSKTTPAQHYHHFETAMQRELADPIEAAHTVAGIAAAHATAVDEQSEFPEAAFQALRESGLMGLIVPQQYGGWGASYDVMVEVAQILSGACLSAGMIWAMHCQQVATIIDHAPEVLRGHVLPRIAMGAFVASVTTEQGKGGHLLTALAPLTMDGEEIVLARNAPIVTGGAFGDVFLITMRAGPECPESEVVLVCADREQLSVEIQSGWQSLGMRGTQSVGMVINGRLTHDQVINPPEGFKQLAASTMIPVGHIVWAACWLGAAEGALQQMLAIWRDPRARKGYDLLSDLFAERLARIRLAIDTVRAYLDLCVRDYSRLRSQHGPDSPEYKAPGFNLQINNLKLLASELLFDAVDRLIQLSGLRYGYVKNKAVALERTFRDLRAASMMYSNERLLVANGKLALLGRDIMLA